ncbi:MAG: Holliday junction branch migration protein RuvA [Polyangiales bacterium]
MIGRLSGVVVEHAADGSCVLDVGGVGYEVFVPLRLLGRLPIPQPALLHVHTHVREEAFTLYGFLQADDRAAFRLLMEVSGVGPKLAMTVLSELTANELASAIARGDRKRLEAISGVGKKIVARLLLELKDKLPNIAGDVVAPKLDAVAPGPLPATDVAIQVCDGLTGLGFTRAQAEAAAAKAIRKDPSAPVEQLLRQALATLG